MRCGRFELVTINEYRNARRKMPNCEDITNGRIRQEYDSIKLPTRATVSSAGFDIGVPYDVTENLMVNGQLKLPTGLRFIPYPVTCTCSGEPKLYVLELYVRSSTGTKKGWVLSNGTGIVDSDYYMADNEGHIYICLCRNTLENMGWFECNEPIVQAIFKEVALAEDPYPVTNMRTGGFGSTSMR